MNQGIHAQVLVGEDPQAGLVAQAHVLGTHAHDDLLALVGAEGVRLLRAELRNEILSRQFVPVHLGVVEVHGGQADEAGHKEVGRRVVKLQRRTNLLDVAHGHADDAVGQGQGLGLVVGDVEHGGGEPLVQQQDLPPGGAAEFRIQVAEGLVEQEHLGVPDDGAPHGHALPLAAGELGRLLVELGGEAQNFRRRQHLLMDDVGIFLPHGEGKGHVFIDGHVAVQGVVLEHHGHIPVLGGGGGDVLPVQEQLAGGDILQSGDHPQGGGLAAAGGTHQDDEFSVADLHVEVEYRLDLVVIDFVDMLYAQF